MTYSVEAIFQPDITQDISGTLLLGYPHNLSYVLGYFSFEGQFNFEKQLCTTRILCLGMMWMGQYNFRSDTQCVQGIIRLFSCVFPTLALTQESKQR